MEIRSTSTFFESLEKISRKSKFWRKEFWLDKYYDIKWGIWALCKYFPIVIKMKSYDYYSILQMLKFQLEILNNRLENGLEVPETRIPKINDIKETIELLYNKLEDNYMDRTEPKRPDYKIWFEKIDGKDLYEMKDDDPRTEEEKNLYIDNLHKLEEKEWTRLFELLQKMRGWWD